MKLVFNRDLIGRKIKKGKHYVVVTKMTGQNVIEPSYIILNDDSYPAAISFSNKRISLIDKETMYFGGLNLDGGYEEIESEIPPSFMNDPLLGSEEGGLHASQFNLDLFEHRCWAVTTFTKKLLKAGIEVCDEFKQITNSDISKITYVQAEMSALFLSVGNFFANCSDDQFKTRFDKHNKSNIELLELANISFNQYLNQKIDNIDNLIELNSWRKGFMAELYSILTKKSNFGQHLEKHGLCESGVEEDESEYWKWHSSCLRQGIVRIANAIESIFYDTDVRVYQLPIGGFVDTWGEYCLIFESDKHYYRFYLAFFD